MRKIWLVVTLALALAHGGFGQNYTISTIAGAGWDIPGLSANLSKLQGVAVDGAGNVFMTLSGYSVVVRLDPSGQLSLVAGNGIQGYSGDGGPATLAQISSPTGVAVDSAGNVYFEDAGNNRIRMVSNGVITTVAGGGSGDDGPATSARLDLVDIGPGLALDSAGNIYFSDFGLDLGGIRKVSNGFITTVAGGGFSDADNVPATNVFIAPEGVAVDAAGNIYFADHCSGRIRKVSNGRITTVAGNGQLSLLACAQPVSGPASGKATGVPLDYPRGVAVDTAGNVYFTEGLSGPSRVRKVSNGNITTVAGGSTGPPFGTPVADNVPATSAILALSAYNSIAVDTAGNLYIPDQYWVVLPPGGYYGGTYQAVSELARLRKVSNGVITTVAGSSGDSGPATSAQLNLPAGVAVDSAGNLYIGDGSNRIIREVSSGTITTIAGSRIPSSSCLCDSGPASSVGLGYPQGVAADSAGNVYIASGIAFELSHGIITTVASPSAPGSFIGVALDAAGNLYFANWSGNQIQEMSNGVLTTIAGGGTQGFGGDNGPATSAELSGPSGVALDGVGNIYFTDTGNQRVRKISGGVITTVAGNGTTGFSGDNGPATSAQLNLQPGAFLCCSADPFLLLPVGIAADASGNLFIVDSGNQRVRQVSNGVITTVAGNGTQGYSGDGGPAASAQLNNPSGIGIDTAGRIYVSDSGNGRIRVLTPPSVLIPPSGCTFGGIPSGVGIPAAGGTGRIAIQTGASCSWQISGLLDWTTVSSPLQLVGSAAFFLTIAANPGPSRLANLVVAGQPVTVIQSAAPGFGPEISSVATAAGGSPTIAPNTWVEIKGPYLGPEGDVRRWQSSDFVNNQMPTTLDGIRVTMNGENAYVSYISFNQINVLTPPDLTLGPVQVSVSFAGVISAAFTSPAQQASPSLFVFDGGPYVTAAHADSSLIGPASLYSGLTTPAKPGEAVVLFGNGFGPTSPPVVMGSASQNGTLPTLPLVKIGGVAATVQFAGLVSPGLYQINVVVPASAPDGDLAITATYNSATTQAGALLTVQH
jgi:uncharacterized protein (TIGR03437 family)